MAGNPLSTSSRSRGGPGGPAPGEGRSLRRGGAALGWALFAALALSGILLVPATVRTPGYFPLLELHRLAGWAAALVAGPALLWHLAATGSRVKGTLGTALLLVVGGTAALHLPAALDFPEPVGFVALQRRLLAEAVRDRSLRDPALLGAVLLFGLLGLGAGLAGLGALTRTRERAASRWSGAGLVLLAAWALVGGALLHLQGRRLLFGALTLHSAAGTGTVALLVLHLLARRAARTGTRRPIVAAVGLGWLLAAAAAWWTGYEDEHFAGYRPDRVAEVFPVLPMPRTAEERRDRADAARSGRAAHALPGDLQPAVGCGEAGCHRQITREWAGSPHRFSASNAFYRAAVGEAIAMGGMEAAVFCAGCHDPERVLTGTVATAYADGVPEGGSDGVSCTVCHGIVAVEHGPQGPVGNGLYSVAVDPPYPGGDARRSRNIRLDPRRHRQGFVTNELTLSPAPCMGCHRVELGPELGFPETFVLQHPALFADFGDAVGHGCTGCHLPQDAAAQYTHRMAGIAVDLPLFATGTDAGDRALLAEHAEAVRSLTGLRPHGPIEATDFDRRPPDGVGPEARLRPAGAGFLSLGLRGAASAEGLDLELRTLNLAVGHPFPSGPFDLNEVWLELWVADAAGRTLHHRGGLDAGGEVVDPPVRLGAVELGPDGLPLRRHRILEVAAVVDKQVVGRELRLDRLVVPLPPDAPRPLEVRARWLYRRARPEFVRWALAVERSPLPPHVVATARARIE